MTDGKLKAFIDRVLRSREREDAEKSNTKEIYKELAGEGYDKTIVGKVINHLRKDQDKVREQSEQFDLYLEAYLGASHVHARVREAEAAGADVETGEIIEDNSHPRHGAGGAEDEARVANYGASSSADSSRAKAATAASREEEMGERQHSSDSGMAGADEPGRQTSASEDADPAPIPEPADRLAAAADSDRGNVAATTASVVTLQLRTHNPDTHFLSSNGLPRLHGCLKPDACAGSHRKLCFDCSLKHDGPSPSGEAA